jgi:hypothetical protein
MLGFFAKVFGRISRTSEKATKATPRREARIQVEELMSRVLPSANPFSMAWGHYADTDIHPAFSASVDAPSTSSSSGDACGHGDRHGAAFVASLTDASGATGTAQYSPTTGKLTVHVQGTAGGSSLDVEVNGTSVGTLMTGTSGNGKVTVSVPARSIQAGTTITVGDLTGTFAQVEFTASLTGATGVSGNAQYNSEKNVLHVSVTGAAANTTYNVTVNGTVVGQLTTNSSGAGKLKATPVSGVTIDAGSTLAVSDTQGSAPILTGTFA